MTTFETVGSDGDGDGGVGENESVRGAWFGEKVAIGFVRTYQTTVMKR